MNSPIMNGLIWTPSDVISMIAALGALLVSVINALKGTRTQTRTDDNLQRINTISQHLQNHDQQMTTLAMNIPVPGGTSAMPASGASAAGTGSDLGSGDLIAPQPGGEDTPQ